MDGLVPTETAGQSGRRSKGLAESNDLMLVMFRLAWTFGFVSTREYSARMRASRFGHEAGDATDDAVKRLERTLLEDRAAMIIFLIALIILAYTALNAPA